MNTYSYGCAPDAVILKSLPEKYSLQLNDADYALFAKLVNIGIDSRLEAIITSNDKIKTERNKACLSLDKQSMLCLLHRLADCPISMTDKELDQTIDLRSAILSTLDIEEI